MRRELSVLKLSIRSVLRQCLLGGALSACLSFFTDRCGAATVATMDLAKLAPAATRPVDFDKDIEPIFEKSCVSCHGPDKQKSGFRLDTREGALKGGDNYSPAIKPGDSAGSPLIHLVSGLVPDTLMPKKGDPLTKEEIGLLRAWVDRGAPWNQETNAAKATHWSLRPVERPPVPQFARHKTKFINPIDAFIAANLEEKKLTLSPAAGRRTLIRRLYLVTHGLPPSPEEVKQFVDDRRFDALEKLVDRVLASPRYGERWARHWLDVARFAESNGFETNHERKKAYPYRDYVIRSLNDDKPYDQFIKEQIAGDAFGADAGTGFLVAGAYDLVKSPDINLTLTQRQDELADIVNTTGTAFLGLTLGCARCHDHKFDPISQKDYYAVQAVFAGVNFAERPIRHELNAIEKKELASLKEQMASRERVEQNHQSQARIAELSGGEPAWIGTFSQPKTIHRLFRGDPMQEREVVAPGAVTVLGTLGLAVDAPEQKRRIELANWIASPRNPLTARVMVNRIWQYVFGTGIVDTPSDFGANGGIPANPALLDWLADEFARSGWSIKHIQKLILLSRTFGQSSSPRPEAMQIDASARLLWRFPPRRLEAEAIRDCMLSVSGALDLRMGGPGFHLQNVEEDNVDRYFPKETFGTNEFRRMVYLTRIRQEQDSVFGAFDCPSGNQVMPRRSRSNTPLQALNLFNSNFVLQQACLLAVRLRREAGDRPEARVQKAFQLMYGRNADRFEGNTSTAMIREQGLEAFCRGLYNTSEFLFIF